MYKFTQDIYILEIAFENGRIFPSNKIYISDQ